MQLCSGGKWNSHDEICFEGNGHGDCPLCKALEAQSDKDVEIKNLEKKNDDLQSQIETLEEDLSKASEEKK